MKNGNITPEVPKTGIVYGQTVYWLVMLGIAAALIGSIMCVISPENPNSASILGGLLNGDSNHILWEECAGLNGSLNGYWYLFLPSHGDRIAMFGIAITCIAAIFGMWGASVTMVFTPKHARIPMNTLYFILAIVVSVVLTLSALGIISLEH